MPVPYKCTQSYDGGSFDKYPERRGWKVSLDKIYSPEDFFDKDTTEIESFFQSWLFFGTLYCVFTLAGVEISDTDFIITKNGVASITFDNLLEKIELWSDKTREKLDAQGDSGSVKAIQGILNRVIHFTKQCEETHKCPFSNEISLSILTLAYLLAVSGRLILSGEGWPSVELTAPFLQERFDDMGWCKSDIERLFREFNTNGYYYMALQPSPNKELDHSKCNDQLCQARNIDESTYVTRHTENCDGKDIEILSDDGDLVKRVVEIIDADGIPVVALETIDGSTATVRVRNAATDEIPFVAISHVWADGLGNSVKNSLPHCQISRIQSLVNKIPMSQTDGSTYFWMDTLCVPVAKEHRQQRQKSIVKMRDVYISAWSVLVLDTWIQQLPVSSSAHHKVTRLFVGNWIQRLWTLQESLMAKHLYVQFQGGAQTIGEMRDDVISPKKPSTNIFFHFSEMVIHSSFDYLSYGETIRQSKVVTGERNGAATALWFAHLSRTLGQRATSKRSDETICLGTTLAFDINALVQIKGNSEEETAGKRMEEFFLLLAWIPKGIIFHGNAHLKRDGFRWAPNSFMGGRAEEFWRGIDKGYPHFQGQGLRVTYPGMLGGPLTHAEYQREFLIFTFQSSRIRCCKVKFSAIDSDFKWELGSYIGIITGGFSEGVSDAMLGVIRSLGSRELPKPQSNEMPILLNDITIRCEGRCVVRKMESTEGMDPKLYMPGRLMSENQAWLIL